MRKHTHTEGTTRKGINKEKGEIQFQISVSEQHGHWELCQGNNHYCNETKEKP